MEESQFARPQPDEASRTSIERIPGKPVRIAHIIKATGLAGAERHLLTLLAGMRARGVDARLIVLVEPRRPAVELFTAAKARGIPTIRCPILGDADPTLWIRLARHLRRFQPDLVHTHLVHADLHGGVAARAARIPLVISTRHNDDAFRRRGIWQWIHHRHWSQLTGGIAVSEAVAEFSRQVEGAPADRLVTVLHGIDFPDHRGERSAVRAELGFEADDLVVGMVGRLTRQKGFDLGLEAAGRLARELPSLRIVVIGDGPLRDALQRQGSALGIGRRAQFRGWQPNAARSMAGFDLLLVPSRWEGFGLVVLEALGQEVLVVGSPVGAIPEILTDGVTGLIARAAGADEILDRLRAGATNRDLRARLARAGREHVLANFSPERMIDETLAAYTRFGIDLGAGA